MDNSFRVKSLDNHYYVDGFKTFTKKVIADHMPKTQEEIELKKGDIISLKANDQPLKYTANLLNGFMIGTNQRTKRKDKFPPYKVVEFYAHALFCFD